MSRLIVKNLPPYVTPARLQQHFEQKGSPAGTLTDVKVAFKNDGTSRRFGFVGYKTNEEALTAKEWFDKTFVDSSKISVNIVEGVKDAPKPRPNKRPRIDDTSVEDVLVKSTTKALGSTAKSEKSKKDSQLDEFLEVMQTKKGPSWANGVSPEASTSATKLDDSPLPAEDEPSAEEGLSDMEWMRRRMTETTDTAEQGIKSEVPVRIEEPREPVQEAILQTSRLFVRNLAFSCSDSDLTTLFGKFGELSQVHIPVDPSTRQPKGLAYVTFAKAADAVTAYEVLDKTSFQGRIVHILPAVDRKGKFEVKEGEGAKRSVKDENNAQRKATAGKEFNWSMLYMNSDAVASSIADRMNIPKADILNPDSDDPSSSTNPAVKLALAETHIINETKAYLESNGVVLASFSSSRTARADTTILVKNIPYGTSDTQIRELFEPHGTVSRVLVPPAGTIAVVEFEKPDEASRGFRAVAYRRLGNSVIYLEKAPIGIFTDAPPPPSASYSATPGAIPAYAVKIPEQTAEATNEGELAAGTTLFVKNLAFSTTTERLNQMFRNLPSFAFARVQMKPDPKKPDGKLSMGYGFIGFKDVDGARKAMKSMQGFVLDGHALHIKFAGRGADEDVDKRKDGVSSKSRTTKMIVKNVPFEATKKDIRDLFGSHGQLKSVRLPKKFDSRTRGFAFLDFVSRQEAENAYAALRHTHLLGRHLVLEWAEEAEQDLEMLRKKAGIGFGAGKEMPGKKRKLDMSITGENEEDEEE
ncbi:RNA-binding domain-containing protein [Lentinula edodes]|uniref:RNA-binding domain-containing protein n=1 Tax=Lentinula edodes TaxID=5353 RepID=UPI001E8EC7C2|nr:RNA-binding domain-containing protein [Lentinula edodes]KAH7869357.1 RNA-binding domain-containing protein [Lentinula edodes]